MNKKHICIIIAICVVLCGTFLITGLKNNSHKNNLPKNNEEAETNENKDSNSEVNLDMDSDMGYQNSRGALLAGCCDYNGHFEAIFGVDNLLLDLNNNEVSLLCSKPDCIHMDNHCVAKCPYACPNAYKDCLYAYVLNDRRNIVKIKDSEEYMIYRCDESIINLWRYKDMLYFSTEKATYRIDIEGKEKAEKIIDRAVPYYMYFDGDKMFYGDDSFYIYKANLDGTDEVILSEEKGNMLEMADGKLYYRVAEKNDEYGYIKSIDYHETSQNIVNTVLKKNVSRYYADSRLIIYLEESINSEISNIYCMDLDEDKTEIIVENAYKYLLLCTAGRVFYCEYSQDDNIENYELKYNSWYDLKNKKGGILKYPF